MARYVQDGASLSGSRYKYPFYFDHPTTIRSGYFVPIFADSYVAPGSTYNLNFEAFLRALPMTRPPMGDLEMFVGAWFVPHRINWTEFKEHFGENNLTAWTGNYSIERPKLLLYLSGDQLDQTWQDWSFFNGLSYAYASGAPLLPDMIAADANGDGPADYGFSSFALQNYFGHPLVYGTGGNATGKVDALKYRAYASIWNEFIRDQNLQGPILYLKTTTTTGAEDSVLQKMSLLCAPINKVHDLFTGVLPNPQKASTTVKLPMGDAAPISFTSNVLGTSNLGHTVARKETDGTNVNVTSGTVGFSASQMLGTVSGTANTALQLDNSQNLYVDLRNATGANISDFRNAVIVQHYYETLAQFGSKYYEIAQAIWNTRPSNVREDLPEGCGFITFPINIQAVTSHAATSGQPLGYQAAKSETYHRQDSMFTYTTKEHGTLMICCGIRQSRHVYSNRLSRDFYDFDLFSEVNPLFVGSSDVPVYKPEVDATGYITSLAAVTPEKIDAILGYQEYGYQEKFQVSYASGLLNPHVSGGLSDFTMADAYASTVSLSPTFVMEDPSFIGRAFVDQSPFAAQFVCDFKITGSVTRVLAPKTVPGLTRI